MNGFQLIKNIFRPNISKNFILNLWMLCLYLQISQSFVTLKIVSITYKKILDFQKKMNLLNLILNSTFFPLMICFTNRLLMYLCDKI